MKKVLSLLLVFVFLKAQAMALSGGPVFGGVQANYVGIYSGVLVPQIVLQADGSLGSSGGSSAAVGLFTLSQPDTGLATGTVLLFVDGAPFAGTITGIIDADTGELSAVIDANSTFSVTIPVQTGVNPTTGVPIFTLQSFQVGASGSIDARVVPTGFLATNANVAVTPARIAGDASVDISFQINNDGTPDVTKTAQFEVDGFKQSDVAGTTGGGGIVGGGGAGGGTGGGATP